MLIFCLKTPSASEHGLLPAEDLDPVAAGLDDEHPVFVVNCNSDGAPEVALPFKSLGDFSELPHFGVAVQLILAPF